MYKRYEVQVDELELQRLGAMVHQVGTFFVPLEYGNHPLVNPKAFLRAPHHPL